MIKNEKNILKFGLGPGKDDPGFEIRCIVM